MRARILNGELEQTFWDWHPGFRAEGDEKLKVGLLTIPGFLHSPITQAVHAPTLTSSIRSVALVIGQASL